MEVNSTLEQDIRKGQLEDEKIKEIRELMKWARPQALQKMLKEQSGSRREFVCLI